MYVFAYVIGASALLLLAQWEPPVARSAGPRAARLAAADGALLAWFAADLFWLQRALVGDAAWRSRGWTWALGLALAALAANLAATAATNWTVPYAARMLRPLFLIHRLATVRKIAANVAKALPAAAFAELLLGAHVLLAGVAGYIVFAGVGGGSGAAAAVPTCTLLAPLPSIKPVECSAFTYFIAGGAVPGCSAYFTSLEESLIHTFAMTTGAEFPAVMLPALNCARWLSLPFVVAFIAGNVLLLTLVLAAANDAFRVNLREEVLRRYARMFAGFDEAFLALTGGIVAQSPTPALHALTGSGAAPLASAAAIGGVTGAVVVANALHAVGGGAAAAGGHPVARAPSADGLTRADFTPFFVALRQGAVDAALAGRLFDAMAGSAAGASLSRLRFRQLLFCFGRVVGRRVRNAGPPASGGAGAADAVADPVRAAGKPPRLDRPSSQASAAAAGSDAATQSSADVADISDEDGRDDGPDTAPAPVEWGAPSTPIRRRADSARTLAVNYLFEAGIGDNVVDEDIFASIGDADVEVFDGEETMPRWRGRRQQQLGEPMANASAMAGGGAAAVNGRRDFGAGVPSSPPARAAAPPPSHSSSPPSSPQPMAGVTEALSAFFAADVEGLEARRVAELRGGVPRDIARRSCRGRALAAILSLPARVVAEALSVLAVVVAFTQLALAATASAETAALLATISYVTFAVYAAKVLVEAALLGPRRFWRSSIWHRFDAAVVVLGAAAVAVDAASAGSPGAGANLLTVAQFFRAAHALRALRLVPGLALTFLAFFDTLPALARYLALAAAVLYAFALAGMCAFAGALTLADPAVAASSYGVLGFQGLTFDTLSAAMLTELALLNVVDWPVVMEGAVAARGRAARLYFVAFWAVGVAVVLNVTVAFIVEGFAVQKQRRERLARLEAAALAYERGLTGSVVTTARACCRTTATTAVPPSAASARDHGLADWRFILRRSGVDLSRWRLARPPHHMDIYESLYFDDILTAHGETLAELRPGVTAAVDGSVAGAALDASAFPPLSQPPGIWPAPHRGATGVF